MKLKVKYLILLTQLVLQLLLLLKKMPNVSNLVKKNDHNTKINETENRITGLDHSKKYIIAPEFNKLAAENFAARSKQANLVKLL